MAGNLLDGAPQTGVLGNFDWSSGLTTCWPQGTLECLGRKLVDKLHNGHDTVGMTVWQLTSEGLDSEDQS